MNFKIKNDCMDLITNPTKKHKKSPTKAGPNKSLKQKYYFAAANLSATPFQFTIFQKVSI